MEYELKRGQALVITGPQGCGKSTLARKIAEQLGSFVETDFRRLDKRRGLNALLAGEPRTVICDGIPESYAAQVRLKRVLASEHALVMRKCGASMMVKTPNFIFCTGDADALPLTSVDRRFHVVELGRPA